MYALMYYQIALFPECFITHVTSITMLTTMYAFTTLQMKLFIQSTLVKTQMLNIRIYSDTKNNCSKVCVKQKYNALE